METLVIKSQEQLDAIPLQNGKLVIASPVVIECDIKLPVNIDFQSDVTFLKTVAFCSR